MKLSAERFDFDGFSRWLTSKPLVYHIQENTNAWEVIRYRTAELYEDGEETGSCEFGIVYCNKKNWFTFTGHAVQAYEEFLRREQPQSLDFDSDELVDFFEEAISDSMDIDWTSRTGAKAVVRALRKANLQIVSNTPEWSID